MASFSERLRMQSIFGGGNPFSPRTESPLKILDQFMMRLPRPEPTMIPQQPLMMPEEEPESNVRFAPGISPYQEALLNLRGRELDTREKIAGEQEETRRAKLDIDQQRANVSEFKARNPNSRFVINKITGNMEAVNPVTGETIRDFGKSQMGQEELINLNQENALGRITATGEQARETEKVRQTGRETLADINARHRRELEEFKSEQPSKSADIPTQKAKQVELNYNILINRRPDLRPFVKRDPTTGEIVVAEPGKPKGSIFSGRVTPTKEQIDEINNFLFGEEKKEEPKKETPTTTTETAQQRLERLKKQAGITSGVTK